MEDDGEYLQIPVRNRAACGSLSRRKRKQNTDDYRFGRLGRQNGTQMAQNRVLSRLVGLLKGMFRVVLCLGVWGIVSVWSCPGGASAFSLCQPGGCNYDVREIGLYTRDAVNKFNDTIAYTWDSLNQMAIVPLAGGDSVFLQIGGCEHFNYAATYRTSSQHFHDTTYILNRVKWLCYQFFSAGFDNQFPLYIDQGQFYVDSLASDTVDCVFRVIPDSSAITNRVFYGFGVRKLSPERIDVWVSGAFQ